MKISYNSSLWGKRKRPYGLPQRINQYFEYKGTKRCIPVIYRFPKGIVFDIVTFLDESKLRAFYEKYEANEEKLTSSQRRCAQQEHPFQNISVKELWINGKQTESGYSSSSAISIPWAREEDNLDDIRKAYSSILEDTACFGCERFCVSYPEADSVLQKFLRSLKLEKVKRLKIGTWSENRFLPVDIRFEISAQEDDKSIRFKHPVTGKEHALCFKGLEPVEIPLSESIGKGNLYLHQASYEMKPALPKGDTLQFNSCIQHAEVSTDQLKPSSAASIGIIGGADGPTSIFISGKGKEKHIPNGKHGLPLHTCPSIPSFKKEDTARFYIEGITRIQNDEREYDFQFTRD